MVANSDDSFENKQKKVVALKYDTDKEPAPKVTAKGKGVVAEKILEVAEAYDIPIKSDADLIEILEKVDLDDYIPLEVYAVVAEIFAYIYKVNNNKKKST